MPSRSSGRTSRSRSRRLLTNTTWIKSRLRSRLTSAPTGAETAGRGAPAPASIVLVAATSRSVVSVESSARPSLAIRSRSRSTSMSRTSSAFALAFWRSVATRVVDHVLEAALDPPQVQAPEVDVGARSAVLHERVAERRPHAFFDGRERRLAKPHGRRRPLDLALQPGVLVLEFALQRRHLLLEPGALLLGAVALGRRLTVRFHQPIELLAGPIAQRAAVQHRIGVAAEQHVLDRLEHHAFEHLARDHPRTAAFFEQAPRGRPAGCSTAAPSAGRGSRGRCFDRQQASVEGRRSIGLDNTDQVRRSAARRAFLSDRTILD